MGDALEIMGDERQVLLALARIIRAAGSAAREAGRNVGLGESHVLVLQLLEAEGAQRAGEIAQELSFSRSTITAILDGLEERQLILRDRDSEDGRGVVVSMTEAGARMLGSVPAGFQSQFLSRFRAMSEWERALVLAGLLRICEMLALSQPPA
jgi:DNA-binding MarR family transcriptional regulator